MSGQMIAFMGVGDSPMTGPLEKHYPVSNGSDHSRLLKQTGNVDKSAPVYEQPAEPDEVCSVMIWYLRV